MVRKNQKVAFESISADAAAQIILATSGKVKDKEVDPRKQIGTIHVKKYVAIEKINHQYENWIALLHKSMEAKADGNVYDYTAEEQALFDECKKLTEEYLENDGSQALKDKVVAHQDELEKLKNIASSMKFKFSTYSFEVITHMINLMVRELLVFTCDNCLSKGGKLTKESHIPWAELQSKMLSGLYMNTQLVYDAVHGTANVCQEATTDETNQVEEVADEPVEEETVAEETEDTEGEVVVAENKPKKFRPKLTQYITNIFKEITTREPRFNGLLLGKEITSLVNNLVYQVMDRYVNVIKSLLQVGNSKTITDHLAVIATVILLQDDIHTSAEDVRTITDLVQERVDVLKQEKVAKEQTKADAKATEAPVEVAPVDAPVEPVKAKKGAKKAAV